MATDQASNKCKKCDKGETAEMLCCELCGKKEHIVCAGLLDGFELANATWICQQCNEEKELGDMAKSVHSSTSSRRSLRLKLALEQLEVQNRLRMKEIEEEKLFYKKKYELLKQIQDEEERTSQQSIDSNRRNRCTSRNLNEPVQDDITRKQLELLPQRCSTPSDQGITDIPTSSSASDIPDIAPVPSIQTSNTSSLGGTILIPVDMDMSTNRNISDSTIPSVAEGLRVEVPHSSAKINFKTSVAFTSNNLAESMKANTQKQINLNLTQGWKGAAPLIQQSSISSFQYASPYGSGQATAAKVDQLPAATVSGCYAVNSQIPSWTFGNVTQSNMRSVYQPPVGIYTMSSTLPQNNNFSQLWQSNRNNPPTSMNFSAVQSLPSQPIPGHFSVIHTTQSSIHSTTACIGQSVCATTSMSSGSRRSEYDTNYNTVSNDSLIGSTK